jgi:hypothetical protein
VNGTLSTLEENIPAAVNCSRRFAQKMFKNPQKMLKTGISALKNVLKIFPKIFKNMHKFSLRVVKWIISCSPSYGRCPMSWNDTAL